MSIKNVFFEFCCVQNPLRRTYEEAFPKEEEVMARGGAASPLLEFDLQPIGARREWRNVAHRQRYEGTLRQHRDATRTNNLGEEVTQTLERSIQRQIAADRTLTLHSTVHFTMQSRASRTPSNPPPSPYANSRKAVND